MKNVNLFWLSLFLLIPFLFTETQNPDKPLRGDWDFAPVKLWEISKAGEDVFGEPNRIRISEEGTVYVSDPENGLNYIFNRSGEFQRAFGQRGQGPGEVRQQRDIFVVKDQIYIVDTGMIHIFTKSGEYLESRRNQSYRHRPVIFLGKDVFIACPFGIFEAPGGVGKVSRVNLNDRSEKVITKFRIFEGGSARSGNLIGSFVMIGLTPQMTVGYGDNKIYYGMNDTYKIHIADLDGEVLDYFTLKRKKKRVSDEAKRKSFERYGRISRQTREQFIKTTPNDCTFFCRIEIHDGLIYVFVPDILRKNTQKIDLFSLEGKYLYSGLIQLEEGVTMLDSQLDNPVIKDGCLYAALQEESFKIKIAKYRIKYPPLSGR
ncbi:MAG: 6-bladed beta-propeller [Candidatus Aminicenantes bacterium]|jgi:hypothetical protein